MLEDRKTARAHIEDVVTRVVRPAIHRATLPLTVTASHLRGEPITAAEARGRTFEAFAVGESWGGRWDTTWFRMQGTVPADWADAEVLARIELGGAGVAPSFTAEAQIWRDDEPLQGLHHLHRDHPIAASAAGGEVVDLLIEAAANPIPPFHSVDWPLLEADPNGNPMYVLTRAELAIVDRSIEALWFDLRALTQLVDAVPDEPRNSEVFRALVEAVKLIDRRDVAGSVKAARAALAPALDRPSTHGHRTTAVGHAHIDTAWLWPIRETKRKCVRTFSNQIRLMERYPEHHFVCSQAQQYEWIRDEHPTLWAQIVERVGTGQWEPVGGMWVEPDTNVPSGESLVRQVVHGARFFRDELGVESRELWIPDVFGYSAALPQIANLAGITTLVTQKLSWNSVNVFPHSTFWWEGSDGSRLLTHFPPANTYNGIWTADELHRSVTAFADHGRSARSLYPFGFGDGGGGPTREMLEMARRLGDLDGLPRAEIGSVRDFVADIEAESDAFDTWVGELYLEFHRGTYTTHAAIKAGNRQGEQGLRAAELWASAAAVACRDWSRYPTASLDAAWKTLLLNQFHDIIPGSSINWVNVEANRDLAGIVAATSGFAAVARDELVDGAAASVVVFNAGSYARDEVVDIDGTLARVQVPSCGWTTLTPAPTSGDVEVVDGRLENARLRITWDTDGLLSSVWDKDNDREVLAEGARGNLFQLHEDHPVQYDAWDVDLTYYDSRIDLVEVDEIEIVERDPMRSSVRFVRRVGESTIRQTMRLAAGSRRIDFDTEVDWQERHRFLKVAFPVAVRSPRATYEIQHGWIERPTVRNTSWDLARFEVCAHRWADLSETGYGVALLNDCKYGYDILGNVMRLSLLRGPGWPDPEADRGEHRFTYSLLPHAGDVLDGGVIEEAEALNVPLVVQSGSAGTRSFVAVDRPGVRIEAVKKADDDDDLVVRVCEVAGGRGPARITVDAPVRRAAIVDLLERELEEVAVDGATVTVALRPFQLVTLKLDVSS